MNGSRSIGGSIFGRSGDPAYYELLERGAGNAKLSSDLLRDLIARYPESADLGREILLCEQEGDRVTHDIIHRLNNGGRPPFAKSEMHALATSLDDIVDLIEQVADSFSLYKIEAPMDQAQELARILQDTVAAVVTAIGALHRGESLAEALVDVHRLENEGDRVSRDAIASLFAGGIDPMVVIRWKDIFEQLEQAIDACEDVAHMLESIALVEL